MVAQLQRAGLQVWLPAFVFAHAFALFWIVCALGKLAPNFWAKCKRFLGCRSAPPAKLQPAKSSELWREQRHVGPTLLLEWEDLGCAYNTAAGLKPVLQGVSGAARPFEMLALMGPSGAGKSTLLDILAARKSVGRLAGRVLVNGVPRGASFARHTSYVPQEDSFLPTMTVAETLALHAALTLPRGTDRKTMADRTDEVLAAMGMLHARDTLVGGVLPGGLSLRGLSGGERKRVSVAAGILAAPSIIFLDEPTSGLDSCSALSVVEHLRDRARDSGLTIVASIHQPRAAVWAAFDTCTLLSGGLLMYTGACGGVVPWFESIGMGPWRSDVHGTACDWVMDLVNIGFANKPHLGDGGGRSICSQEDLEEASRKFAGGGFGASSVHAFTPGSKAVADSPTPGGGSLRSDAGDDTEAAKDADRLPNGAGARSDCSAGSLELSSDGGGGVARRRRASWWTVFRALYWREILWIIRNPADVAGRMLLFVYMGTVCGLVFWRMGDGTGLEAVRNRINVLFIQGLCLLLMPYVYMSLYAADKRHYTNDIGAGLYTPSTYYAAKSLASLPFMVINVLVCAFTAYGMTGMRLSATALFINGAASVLQYLVAQQFHSMASIVMPNEDTCFLVTIVWSALNMYFSNFIVRFTDITMRWLTPIGWFSTMNYAFAAYLKAEFSGVDFPCASGLFNSDMVSLVRALLPGTPSLRGPAVVRVLESPGAGCVIHADAVLQYFSVTRPVFIYLLIMIGHLGFLHVATFLGLVMLARKERR